MSDQPNIQVYNTLSRTKEPFETVQPGKVGMYLCGPTVYKEAHIGHMVGPVIFDCIKRYNQIDEMPKATDHIGQIVDFIQALIDKGYAYASEGDVYFEVGKDEDYGKLTNRSVDESQGEGGEMASRKRAAL